MNETKNLSAGSGLGTAGLILGILSIPFGVIPCTFLFALIMGILGIILSSVAYSQARQSGGQTGLIIAALIISIMGTSFSLLRMTSSVPRSKAIFESWKSKVDKWENNKSDIENSFNDAFKEGFEEEYNGNLKETLNELEQNLDDLEKELESAGNEIDKNFNRLTDEEKAKKLGKATGKALKGFVDEMNDTSHTH
jgi:hypothetical protein